MNYNKIIPFRHSIIGPRSSIMTGSIKNSHNYNHNSMHFDSFSNAPNLTEEEDGPKQIAGMKPTYSFGPHPMFNKGTHNAQRRSGFVGLTSKKESSAKRISTRWNNMRDTNLANMFA